MKKYTVKPASYKEMIRDIGLSKKELKKIKKIVEKLKCK